MIFVLAEKPYAAKDIAEALCVGVQRDTAQNCFWGEIRPSWFRSCLSNKVCIAYCNGHLLEMAPPERYDSARSEWRLDQLPFLPEPGKFLYEPKDAGLLETIRVLAVKSLEIVNACDAGAEGELIFQETMDNAGTLDPERWRLSRMWIQDTTPDGIRRAFASRTPGNDPKYIRLGKAAEARQQVDWLLGMNASRYATLVFRPVPPEILALHRKNGPVVFSIGRVQTPVLGLVHDRTQAVLQWVPKHFHRVYVSFAHNGEKVNAEVLAPKELQYNNHDTQFHSEQDAKAIHRAINVGALVWDVFSEQTLRQESPPPPFSLVDLQRTANRMLGWSSSYTLRIAQSLYARYKAISYPRTESDRWPPTMEAKVVGIWRKLWADWALKSFPELNELPPLGDSSLRYFKEGSDEHHAITPTGVIPPMDDQRGHPLDEYLLWKLILARFLVSLMPSAVINASVMTFIYREELPEELQARYKRASAYITARYTARIIVQANYLAYEQVLGRTRDRGQTLAESLKEKFPPFPAQVRLGSNSYYKLPGYPPEYFTEDTLLEHMVRNGLGTAATRAECIEKLHDRGLIYTTDQKQIRVTSLGAFLVLKLQEFELAELMSPQQAAVWDNYFGKLEDGHATLEGKTAASFVDMMRKQVAYLGTKFLRRPAGEPVVFCPKTGWIVTRRENPSEAGPLAGSAFYFQGYIKKGEHSPFPEVWRGRQMSALDYHAILMGKQAGGPVMDGFVSRKTGEKFNARVVYSASEKDPSRRLSFSFATRGQVVHRASHTPPTASP